MKLQILIFLLCASLTVKAQKMDLPVLEQTDSTSLAKHLVTIAEKTIAAYQETDKKTYLDNLFRLQLTAKKYPDIETTLNLLEVEHYGDSITHNSIGFAYRAYAKTMAKQPVTKEAWQQYYKQSFQTVYQHLNKEEQTSISGYFATNIKDRKEKFTQELAKHRGHNSISIQEAIALCRAYIAYLTASTTLLLGQQQIAAIEAEKYLIDNDIIITLPNGSTIAGTLVRDKKNTQPLPVVMRYNIYAGLETALGKEIANKGYVGFIANTRGKRLSKDNITPYEYDGDDAYPIIDWISKQPWCNGKVGMYGGSYLGFSQWSALKKVHPALKTIVPQVAVGAGIDFPMQNGVFMSYALRWIRYVSNTKLTDEVDFSNTDKWDTIFTKYFTNGSSFRSLDQIEGKPAPLFQRWLDHPTYDAYWQNMVPQKEAYKNITIPILTITGYYDDDQLGAMHYYNEYQKWNKSNNHYLLIGPYDHGGAQGFPKKTLGGYAIDPAAVIPIDDLVFEWFDFTLKEGKRPELLKDKVNFQVMGKNTWQHVPNLAQMHNNAITFYLNQDDNQYQLVTTKPNKQNRISQTVDFKNRNQINVFKDTDVAGFPAVIQKELHPEEQMMVFESAPFDEAVTLSGALSAMLQISCNKKDVDIALQLYEKTKEGLYIALSNNLQRASHAKNKSKRQLLTPNQLETIPITNTFMIVKQIEKGSQIVIVLGVNKNPNWQINYGTGKNVSDETIADAEIPLQIQWHGNSSITLPVVK